jgi:hypothetical protein
VVIAPALTRNSRSGAGAAGEQVAQVPDADRVLLAGQGRLHGDQPLEQELLGVLVAHVQHPPMPAGGDMPGRLQRPGALADPLGTADQEQLADPDPAVQVGVERAEPGRDAAQPVGPPGPDVAVELLQHPAQTDDPVPMHPRLPRRGQRTPFRPPARPPAA